MKVGVGVVTYNAISTMRLQLLERTLVSIEATFKGCDWFLFDNGYDGSWQTIQPQYKEWCWTAHNAEYVGANPGSVNMTPGCGRNNLFELMRRQRYGRDSRRGYDLYVMSDDDMVWKPGALERLVAFWSDAPDDLMGLCGLLEDDYPWNTPRGLIVSGGERALWRDSAPGAAWTVSRATADEVFPVAEQFGYDHRRSEELKLLQLKVAQMDLAEHIGWEASTHGNTSQRRGRPLDRERWGV